MKGKISILILIILSISFITPMISSTARSKQSGDYITLRTQVPSMYIANQSINLKIQAMVFRDDKPSDESSTIHVEINKIDSEYSYETEFNVKPQKTTKKLISLDTGHYEIKIYAKKDNIKSREVAQNFGVSKPPVPYEISFTNGGKAIFFKSKKINSTGHIDPNFKFTIKIYRYRHGQGETLIRTIKNVTDIKINIKESWQSGIIIVHVIDRWGWQNSADMNIDQLQFTGSPEQYDYEQTHREPYESRRIYIFILIAVFLIVLYFIGSKIGG